jgi:hypothetical protein
MLQTKAVAPAKLGLLRHINDLEGFEHFCLVGVTNLALRYGHRISVDIDFFLKEKFDSNSVVPAVSRHFRNSEQIVKLWNCSIILHYPYHFFSCISHST